MTSSELLVAYLVIVAIGYFVCVYMIAQTEERTRDVGDATKTKTIDWIPNAITVAPTSTSTSDETGLPMTGAEMVRAWKRLSG